MQEDKIQYTQDKNNSIHFLDLTISYINWYTKKVWLMILIKLKRYLKKYEAIKLPHSNYRTENIRKIYY